jgi:hypothetical protein
MEDILRGKSPAVCAQRVVKQYDNVNIYFKRYDTLLPSGHPVSPCQKCYSYILRTIAFFDAFTSHIFYRYYLILRQG